MIIYKITNLVNGKIYIGQTIQTLEKRWKQHCRKNNSCSKLFNAINKYGKQNFLIEELYYSFSIEDLNEKEIYFISFFDSFNNGYNLTTGGNNYKRSSETILKFKRPKSKITKQKMSGPKSEEHKKNISLGRIGIKTKGLSEETKKKMSITRTGNKNPMYGKIGFGAKKIRCVNTGQVFLSIAEAARQLNLFSQSISDVLNKKYKHTKNYIFEYVEN